MKISAFRFSLAAALLAPCALFANTLLWYRFGGEGTTITNVANPGVMDGTLKGIKSWWDSFSFDDAEAKFPVRCDAFTNGVRVIDPKTDTLYPEGRALSWTGGSSNTGAVVVPGADLTSAFKEATNFTYEAFFKVSQATIDRATGGGNVMFPIIHWGRDSGGNASQEGVIFSLYYNGGKLAPYWRMGVETNGLVSWPSQSQGWMLKSSVSLDVWHHIALVAATDAGAKTITMNVYLDYNPLSSLAVANCDGIRYSDANAYPLVIGANPFNSGRAFLGELAEVRISDEVLSVREFLRPVPPGPVDADTLVYLPLGDTPWFATQVPLNTGIWNAPLNGAPTAAWNPLGWWTSPVSANYPCGVPAIADDAHGSAVRGGCLDTNALEDVKSITFSTATAISGSGNLGHILELPKTDLATLYHGDFTFEWFFKTSYQSNQAMLVNPWTKVMINSHKIHPRVGDYNSGSNTGSASGVDDGHWHHCALVYRHSVNTFECWIDYKLDRIATADALKSDTSKGFFFGGQDYNTQVFNGELDDLRITKRALAPHEFLTTIPVAAGASTTDILHATLESSLASGQDEFFVSNGVVRICNSNSAGTAAYADIQRDIDYDNDGEADVTSTKALVLDGSNYLFFNTKAALMTRDFTVEFFAKVTGTGNGAQFIHFARNGSIGSYPRWALAPDGTVSVLCSANGVSTGTSRNISANTALSIADGRWHHWAVTASADYTGINTTVKVYRDYEEVAGGTSAESLIYFGLYDHCLLLGYSGNTNGGVVGQFDEIRFRPGVQPVSSFMRSIPSSRTTVVVFR